MDYEKLKYFLNVQLYAIDLLMLDLVDEERKEELLTDRECLYNLFLCVEAVENLDKIEVTQNKKNLN